MTSQGVPGFILVSRELRIMQQFCHEQFQKIEEKYIQMNGDIRETIASLPNMVIDQLLEKIRIDGVQPVTLESIRSLILSVLTAENSPLHSMNQEIRNISQTLANRTSAQEGDNTSRSAGRTLTGFLHDWPGDEKLHKVPFGFKWPHGKNTRTLWDLWFFGNANDRIQPFRLIEPKFELVTKLCHVDHTRTKGVMGKMIHILITDGKIQRDRDINEVNSQVMFEYSFSKIIHLAYDSNGTNDNRPGDLVLGTIYERLRRKKMLK